MPSQRQQNLPDAYAALFSGRGAPNDVTMTKGRCNKRPIESGVNEYR
jgi:hypothetical protein